MKAILLASILFYSALATPDCYDYSVTKQVPDYMEVLPLMIYYNRVDWMNIDPNSNCGVYTYGDVLFKSYDPWVSSVQFVFYKGEGVKCTLDNAIKVLETEHWLYSNSILADQTVCGYYIGVANSDEKKKGMFMLIRTNAVYIQKSLALISFLIAFVMLN